MEVSREKLVVIAVVLALGSWMVWNVTTVAPAAIPISGNQILKQVTVDGNTVTSGIWVVQTAVNFPSGSVVLMKDMTSDLDNGQARTQREIQLEFLPKQPYYRALLQMKTYGIETKYLYSVGVVQYYIHKQFAFEYYAIPDSWRDSWTAFDVKMRLDGTLVDTEARVMIGPDPSWGASTGTVEGQSYYSRAILQFTDPSTGRQESLTVYGLGWLDRGLTEPSKNVAIIWDPYDQRWEYVAKNQLESRLETEKQHWVYGFETYGQIYDALNLSTIPRLSVSGTYEATDLVVPSGKYIYPNVDPANKIGTGAVTYLQIGTKANWDFGWFGWGGPLATEETNTWILGKSGHIFSVNVSALITADATLFDTIVWRPAAGIPDIITYMDPVIFTSGGKGIQEVVVKNAGTTTDSFIGTLQLTNTSLTATMTDMAADVAPNGVGIVRFEITGPIQYEDLASANNKITIQNTGEPIKEDVAYFNILMRGKTEPGTKVASVSGYVLDRDTDEGISDVRVLVKGLQISDYSERDGYYSIRDIPTGDTTRSIDIEFTKVGYDTETVTGVTIEVNKDTRVSAVYMKFTGYKEPFPWMLVIIAVGIIALVVCIVYVAKGKLKLKVKR